MMKIGSEVAFFSFAALLDGFKHCRPMLMVDGTFFKGKHKGILLSAVARTVRKIQMFMIACCSSFVTA